MTCFTAVHDNWQCQFIDEYNKTLYTAYFFDYFFWCGWNVKNGGDDGAFKIRLIDKCTSYFTGRKTNYFADFGDRKILYAYTTFRLIWFNIEMTLKLEGMDFFYIIKWKVLPFQFDGEELIYNRLGSLSGRFIHETDRYGRQQTNIEFYDVADPKIIFGIYLLLYFSPSEPKK